MRAISGRARPDLFFRFKRAHLRLVAYAARRVAEATGAPPAQVAAVVLLARGDGIPVKELGEQLGLNSAGVTGLVARLERRKLVRRAPNPGDRREIHVHLTPRGRATARRVAPLLAELSKRMTRGFDTKEIATIERFLSQVSEGSSAERL